MRSDENETDAAADRLGTYNHLKYTLLPGLVFGVDCNREMLGLARKHAPAVDE